MSRLAPRIGYVPYSRDLSHPADRRRFCHYAKKRGLVFDIANPREHYDVVVVSENADTSVWSRYPRWKGRVIYELIDSYLAIPERDIKGLLRGVARFATGRSRHLDLRYQGEDTRRRVGCHDGSGKGTQCLRGLPVRCDSNRPPV